MVYVRLAQSWVGPTGAEYPADSMVDVDAATLAELEARGVVAEAAALLHSDGETDPTGGPHPTGDPDPTGGPHPTGDPTPTGGPHPTT